MPRARNESRLVEDERAESGGRGTKRGVDDRGGDGDAVAGVGDTALHAG